MKYYLTRQEKKAIEDLQDLAARWPKTLWLFSANGSLCVMKKDTEHNRVMNARGGVDNAWWTAQIDIENDGGDW